MRMSRPCFSHGSNWCKKTMNYHTYIYIYIFDLAYQCLNQVDNNILSSSLFAKKTQQRFDKTNSKSIPSVRTT